MKGWTVTVECPHGTKHALPLSWVYNMRPPEDRCPEAVNERVRASEEPPKVAPGRIGVWWGMRKLERRLRKGKL